MAENKGYIFDGFDCLHLQEHHPARMFEQGSPDVEFPEASSKGDLHVGMKGVCKAAKRFGGICNHDCQEAIIAEMFWMVNYIAPLEPVLGDGSICTAKKLC